MSSHMAQPNGPSAPPIARYDSMSSVQLQHSTSTGVKSPPASPSPQQRKILTPKKKQQLTAQTNNGATQGNSDNDGDDINDGPNGSQRDRSPSGSKFIITRNGEMIFEGDETSSAPSASTSARFRYAPTISQAQRTTELRRERKWLEMFLKWEQWHIKKDHIKQRTRKGIPESLRGVFWSLFADANKMRVEKYKELGLTLDDTPTQLTQGQLVARMKMAGISNIDKDDFNSTQRSSFISRNSFSIADRVSFMGATGSTMKNNKSGSETPTNAQRQKGQQPQQQTLHQQISNRTTLPTNIPPPLPVSSSTQSTDRGGKVVTADQDKDSQATPAHAVSLPPQHPRPPSGQSAHSGKSNKGGGVAGATPPPPPPRLLNASQSQSQSTRTSNQNKLSAVNEGIGLDLNNNSISGTTDLTTNSYQDNDQIPGTPRRQQQQQQQRHHQPLLSPQSCKFEPQPTIALPPPPPPRNLNPNLNLNNLNIAGSTSASITNQDDVFQRTNSNHLNLMDSPSADNLQPLQHSASSGLIIDSGHRLDLYKKDGPRGFRDRNSVDSSTAPRNSGGGFNQGLALPLSPASASLTNSNSACGLDIFHGIPENSEHYTNTHHSQSSHSPHPPSSSLGQDGSSTFQIAQLPRPSRSGPQHHTNFGPLPSLPSLGTPTALSRTEFGTTLAIPHTLGTPTANSTLSDDYVMVQTPELIDLENGTNGYNNKKRDQLPSEKNHHDKNNKSTGGIQSTRASNPDAEGLGLDDFETRPKNQGGTGSTTEDDQYSPTAATSSSPPPLRTGQGHTQPPKFFKKELKLQLPPLLTSPSDLNQGQNVVAVSPTACIPSPTNTRTPSNASSLTNHRPVLLATPSKQDHDRDYQRGGQAPNLDNLTSSGSTVNETSSLQSPLSELGSYVFFSYTLRPDQEVPEEFSLYRKLASTQSEFDSLICKDVKRTFASHVMFAENNGRSRVPVNRARQFLADICRAYVHFDTDLGYCQGISFLVATLLMYMEAEDAFWVLVSLLQNPRYNLRGLFTTGFPLLQEYMYVTGELMKKVDSKLYKHLNNVGFTYSVCMPQWLMGLYVYALPLSIGLRIWDCLLYEGPKILVRTALYLITHFRKQLLNEPELDGVFNVIMGDLPQATELYADADKFMAGVYKISITTEDIDKLAKKWQADNPPPPPQQQQCLKKK